MTSKMDAEENRWQMDLTMKAGLKEEREMEKELISGLMEVNMKAIGLIMK